MAYQVEIEADFDREPFEDAFGGQSVSFLVGHDVAADLTVFMSVLMARKEPGIYDLRFGLEEREISRDGWSNGMDYSISTSKRYVPREHRPQVLALLLMAIEAALAKCSPVKITMRSFHKNLPEKALRKYLLVCELMKAHSLEIAENFVGTDGVHHWLFVRK
jgi:hypothetical protein